MGLAFFAQHWLTPLGSSRAFDSLPRDHAAVGFALLLVAGIAAAVVVWFDADAEPSSVPPRQDLREPRPPIGLLYASVLAVSVATAIAFVDVANRWAIYPWAAGLLLLAGTAARGGAPSDRSQSRAKPIEWLGLALILALALAWRLPGLAEIPAQVHGDEAACGLEARRILRGEVPNLLGLGWYDIPYLSFAVSAAFMRVFGDDLFGLRMASVVLGVGSVALLYFIVRRLFGVRPALMAAFLLAVSHWHVHFSRIGTDYMQASCATLLALLFFVRAGQEGRRLDWVLAGMGIGLACSVYFAGRVSIVIVASLQLADWLSARAARRQHGGGTAWMAVAAMLFVAPTIAVMARQPLTLVGRSSGVFVLSPPNLEHSFSSTETDDLAHVLAMQVANSFSAFNWRGDRSQQHSHRAPLLDFWSGGVFAVGLVAFSAVGWRRRYRLVAVWFWSNFILGSVLTVDAMFSPRMIVAVPVISVLVALVLEKFCVLGERGFAGAGRRLSGLAVAGLLAASAIANYRDYFVLHVQHLQPAGAQTVLSRYVRAVNSDYRIYLYGNHSLRYDTPRFLVPGADVLELGREVIAEPVLPSLRAAGGKGAVFVLDAGWQGAPAIAAKIRDAYPAAARETLDLGDGLPAFLVFRVVDPAQPAR